MPLFETRSSRLVLGFERADGRPPLATPAAATEPSSEVSSICGKHGGGARRSVTRRVRASGIRGATFPPRCDVYPRIPRAARELRVQKTTPLPLPAPVSSLRALDMPKLLPPLIRYSGLPRGHVAPPVVR